MAVRQRGSSWQVSLSRNGKRWRRQFRVKADAEAWEQQSKEHLDKGRPPVMDEEPRVSTSARLTLRELQRITYERYWADTKGEANALRNSDRIVEFLGADKVVWDIGAAEVDLVVAKARARGLSNATVNRYLAALSKMLKTAKRYNDNWSVPLIERLKEKQGRTRVYTDEEFDSVIQMAHQIAEPEMADLTTLGLDTGLRQGELLKLRPRDLVEDAEGDPWVRVRNTKSGKDRDVPLLRDGRSHQIILRRAEGLEPEELLFTYNANKTDRVWRTIRELLGQDHDAEWVFHTLRHSYCSRLAHRGFDVLVIMKLAGHSTPQVTMRYFDIMPPMLKATISEPGATRAAPPQAAPVF